MRRHEIASHSVGQSQVVGVLLGWRPWETKGGANHDHVMKLFLREPLGTGCISMKRSNRGACPPCPAVCLGAATARSRIGHFFSIICSSIYVTVLSGKATVVGERRDLGFCDIAVDNREKVSNLLRRRLVSAKAPLTPSRSLSPKAIGFCDRNVA